MKRKKIKYCTVWDSTTNKITKVKEDDNFYRRIIYECSGCSDYEENFDIFKNLLPVFNKSKTPSKNRKGNRPCIFIHFLNWKTKNRYKELPKYCVLKRRKCKWNKVQKIDKNRYYDRVEVNFL